MSKRLIVTDVDGTLLTSNKIITENTLKTINNLKNENVDFTIATGRIYPACYEITQKLTVNAPLILSNGAIIKNPKTREVYLKESLNRELVGEILNILEKNKVFYYYYTENSLCAKESVGIIKSYEIINSNLSHNKRAKIYIEDNLIKKSKEDEIIKIAAYDKKRERLNEIQYELSSYFKEINIFSSTSNNMEIVKTGISKGNAVKFLEENFNYKLENVMCIGDEDNDMSMLQVSGFPVAMGNGNEEIKKIAKFVTSTNDEEGLAKAINKFLERR